MNIIPAIDLYDGACVRLNQGKFEDLTKYEIDPIRCANHYASQGATEIHVVDLNGAKEGKSKQLKTILNIKEELPLRIQVGGGFRTKEAIVALLSKDIDRVVLGSLAVTDPELIRSLILEYGVDRIVLAFDITVQNEPLVAIRGWQEKTDISLWSLLDEYKDFAHLRILCTDINRDGMLMGPNISLYKDCMKKFPQFNFQASGGVSRLNDLLALKKVGVASVIIGKALYENRFSLSDALREVSSC